MAPSMSTRRFVPTILTWFMSVVMLVFASASQANGRVYQVEVIIFERGTHSSGSDAEGGQKNVPLKYPENWQRLVDPDEEAANQTQADKDESLRLSDEFLQTLAEERGEPIQDSPSAVLSEPSQPEGPKYFEYLDEQSLGLRKTRDALTRRNHYRVLFHETWLQPMTSPEKAPALILHGGKRYGDFYELQGYISLSASRFLHVQTDLWLSEFSVNHGQDFGSLPQLPMEPYLVSQGPSEGSSNSQFQSDDSNMVNLTSQGNDSTWAVTESRWQQVDSDQSPYLVNQISTLRQKRRMRSGELHYLDHPKLGVLIKITPQQNTNE